MAVRLIGTKESVVYKGKKVWLLKTPGFLHCSQHSLSLRRKPILKIVPLSRQPVDPGPSLTRPALQADMLSSALLSGSLEFAVYRRYKPPACQTSLFPELPTPFHLAALALIPSGRQSRVGQDTKDKRSRRSPYFCLCIQCSS